MSDEVLGSVHNGVGTIVLNRPKALNSLNTNMVYRMIELLDTWSKPGSGVCCIVVKGAGGKAYCAGGDVKTVVLQAQAGDFQSPDTFFDGEYILDAKIANLRIPFIALIDGIVMGGGAGVSIHGHFRVATEKTVFAMPETGIGLFPDIGAAFFLNRLPGRLAYYLGCTGARLTGVTVREAGLATHYLPSSAIDQVEAALHALGAAGGPGGRACRGGAVDCWDLGSVAKVLDGLQANAGPLPQGELSQLLPLVDSHFGQPSMPAVWASLEEPERKLAPGDKKTPAAAFVANTLAALRKGSPISQAVTWELLNRAAHAPLQTVLDSDAAMVRHFCRDRGDFFEGVTAVLIERGRAPRWKYERVEQVPPHVVESFFEGGPFARGSSSSSSKHAGQSGFGSPKL